MTADVDGRVTVTQITTGLSVLPVPSVGDETSGINGKASLHSVFRHLVNLGTNGAPDVVEGGTVNSTNRLGGPIGESTGRLGPGIFV